MRHQRICASIAYQLQHQLGGEAVYKVAVLTTTVGIRVPDNVWMPQDKWEIVSHTTVLRGKAPECLVMVRPYPDSFRGSLAVPDMS